MRGVPLGSIFCYFVELLNVKDSEYRFWMTREVGGAKIVDSNRGKIDRGMVCSKWAHIWVGMEGYENDDDVDNLPITR